MPIRKWLFLVFVVLWGAATAVFAQTPAKEAPFAVRPACQKPVNSSATDPNKLGLDVAAGMMDCLMDASTEDGMRNVTPNAAIPDSLKSISSFSVIPTSNADKRYSECKQLQASGYPGVTDNHIRQECDSLIFAYQSLSKENPYTVKANDSFIVQHQQGAAAQQSNLSGLGVKTTTQCVDPPAVGASAASASAMTTVDDSCSITKLAENKACQVTRNVVVHSFSQYQCNVTPEVKSAPRCDRVVQCVPLEGDCVGGGVDKSTIVSDMSLSRSVDAASGDVLLAFPGRGGYSTGIYEHTITFNVDDPARVPKMQLDSVVFDDWFGIYVNDHFVWGGPYGSMTKMEPYYTQSCDENGACSSSWGGVSYSDTGVGPIELGTVWSRSPSADLSRYLVSGVNKIFIRHIVGGGGTFGFQISYRNKCVKCEMQTASAACSSYESRVLP